VSTSWLLRASSGQEGKALARSLPTQRGLSQRLGSRQRARTEQARFARETASGKSIESRTHASTVGRVASVWNNNSVDRSARKAVVSQVVQSNPWLRLRLSIFVEADNDRAPAGLQQPGSVFSLVDRGSQRGKCEARQAIDDDRTSSRAMEKSPQVPASPSFSKIISHKNPMFSLVRKLFWEI